jgi:hypothetical protein
MGTVYLVRFAFGGTAGFVPEQVVDVLQGLLEHGREGVVGPFGETP